MVIINKYLLRLCLFMKLSILLIKGKKKKKQCGKILIKDLNI